MSYSSPLGLTYFCLRTKENKMKKEFNKILMIIGFVVASLGAILVPVVSSSAGSLLSTAFIAPILAICFVFAKNNVLKNVGYALTVLCAIYGVTYLVYGTDIDSLLMGAGLLIMFAATLIYFLLLCLKFFGFVKSGKNKFI